jgi:reverse gyrase
MQIVCYYGSDLDSEAKMGSDSTRELLANLLKRRDELRVESEALEKLIETYRQLDLLEREDRVDQLDLWKGGRSSRARSAYVAEMMASARRLILTEGRPLTRSELLRRLETEGYIVDGRDKSKVLGTNLWRSGQFQHIEQHGYWPKGTPTPGKFAKRQ